MNCTVNFIGHIYVYGDNYFHILQHS